MMSESEINANNILEIYLVRHGETLWNTELRVQGRTDIDLNETGTRQAEELGDLLSGISFAKIDTSPLLRAANTAKIILSKQISHQKPAYIEDSDLTEVHYGNLEGKTYDKVVAMMRERTGNDYESPFDVFLRGDCLPNGETQAQVKARVKKHYESLLKFKLQSLSSQDCPFLVVGHSSCLSMYVDIILGQRTTYNEISKQRVLKHGTFHYFKVNMTSGVVQEYRLNAVDVANL